MKNFGVLCTVNINSPRHFSKNKFGDKKFTQTQERKKENKTWFGLCLLSFKVSDQSEVSSPPTSLPLSNQSLTHSIQGYVLRLADLLSFYPLMFLKWINQVFPGKIIYPNLCSILFSSKKQKTNIKSDLKQTLQH